MSRHVATNRVAQTMGDTFQRPGAVLNAQRGTSDDALGVAKSMEASGFGLIACPGNGSNDNVGFAQRVLAGTSSARVATSIANIYYRHPLDYAATALHLQELSGDRFILGVGVGHATPWLNGRFGVTSGKPAHDLQRWVETYREGLAGESGPPVVVAALRPRMIEMALEHFDGMMCAFPSRRALAEVVAGLDAVKRDSFFVGAHTYVSIGGSDETGAALRERLSPYLTLPAYRAYWRSVGYSREVDNAESLLARNASPGELGTAVSDEMIDDCCIRGTAEECEAQIRGMVASGIDTCVIMPAPPRSAGEPGSPLDDSRSVLGAIDPAECRPATKM